MIKIHIFVLILWKWGK